MTCDSPDSLKAAVKSGTGMGVLYQNMISEELKPGSQTNLTPVGFDLDGQGHLAVLTGRTLPPITTAFLELVRAQRQLITNNGQ